MTTFLAAILLSTHLAHAETIGGHYRLILGNNCTEEQVVQVDLQKQTDAELVELLLNENDWYVRHARRLLQERGENAQLHEPLAKLAFEHALERRRLRGLWALHAVGGLNEATIARGLKNESPYVRAWTIQLALENKTPSPETLKTLAEQAGIEAVDRRHNLLNIKFHKQTRVDPARLMNLVSKTGGAQFTPAGVLLLPLDGHTSAGDILGFLSTKLEQLGRAAQPGSGQPGQPGSLVK